MAKLTVKIKLFIINIECFTVFKYYLVLGRHALQRHDTQHNDTLHNNKKCYTQHYGTPYFYVVMLGLFMLSVTN
jgi:hypothetical protein